VALAQAFGAVHIKTRTFRRWDINEHMIAEAHRRGMRTTGHCAHPLPLIAAGIDSKEHIGICTARGNRYMYDDMVQLFRAAGIGVVPTIAYVSYGHSPPSRGRALPQRVLQRAAVAAEQPDPRAAGGQPDRDLAPDPPARTRDQRDLAVQRHAPTLHRH
jgi:hypothetical protein